MTISDILLTLETNKEKDVAENRMEQQMMLIELERRRQLRAKLTLEQEVELANLKQAMM